MKWGARMFRGLRAPVTLLCLAFVVAACSSEPEVDFADLTTTTSTETTTTTTTEPPTTTSTTEPTSTTLDDEAAVRELSTQFLVDFFTRDEREISLEEQMATLEGLAVDPLLQRTKDVYSTKDELGQYSVNPGNVSEIVSVEMGAEQAVVYVCMRDNGALFSADGDVLIPADDFFATRSLELIKIDGRWWVTEFFGGGEPCESNSL